MPYFNIIIQFTADTTYPFVIKAKSQKKAIKKFILSNRIESMQCIKKLIFNKDKCCETCTNICNELINIFLEYMDEITPIEGSEKQFSTIIRANRKKIRKLLISSYKVNKCEVDLIE